MGFAFGKINAAIENGTSASSYEGKQLVKEVSTLLDDMYGNNKSFELRLKEHILIGMILTPR